MRKRISAMICICAAAALVTAMFASPASAATPVPVYGTPGYTPGVGGYLMVSPNGAVNDAGTAVGWLGKYDESDPINIHKGNRAFRWSASGTVELGNLGASSAGRASSHTEDINAAGTAVGGSDKYVAGINVGNRAVRWDAAGTAATELGHLGTNSGGAAYSAATAINSAGTIVGVSVTFKNGGSSPDTGNRAVRWAAGGTAATELGDLGTDANGKTESFALAIDATGTAVGYAEKYNASGTMLLGARAVRWDAAATAATELGNLGTDPDGVTGSSAIGIDSAGTTFGTAEKYDGSGAHKGSRGVRWAAGGTAATELGNLGADPTGFTGAAVRAANDAGTAAGTAEKYDTTGTNLGFRAVRWDAGGTAATELGILGTSANGESSAEAFDINGFGTAVGGCAKFDGAGTDLGSRAVLWRGDGSVVDLNTLIDPASGWTLQGALDISNTNWVVGVGLFDPAGAQEAYQRLFLMDASSAVPEPSSLGVLACAGLLALRRRRYR